MKAQKSSRESILPAISVTLFCLAAPTSLFAGGDPVVYGMTQGRLTSILMGLTGIASIIAGALALRSSTRPPSKKRTATWSLVLGSVSMIFSTVHLANTTGGFGTGSGKAGAIVAIALGLTGAALGGIALSRSGSAKKEAAVRSLTGNNQKVTDTEIDS